MNINDLKYYLLFKNDGITNKDNRHFYRFIIGCNAGFVITVFVNEQVYNSFGVLDELTDYIGVNFDNNGKHYYITLN